MQYVALLRGIGPGNPNMSNANLCSAVEATGMRNVRAFISSGNVLFETDRIDAASMESELEAAWQDRLGFTSTTVIKSQDDLGQLIALDPFKGLTHGLSSYLLVTFMKRPQETPFRLPHQPLDKPYKVLEATGGALFTTTDNSTIPTTDLMAWLEKQFGKEITSRTWNTVQRIYKKMEQNHGV